MNDVGFILPNADIGGGVHIVLKWAQCLSSSGLRVAVIVKKPLPTRIPFLSEAEINFEVMTYEHAIDLRFDLLFASWWETLFDLPRFSARRYAFFSQALESQFYAPGEPDQSEYERAVRCGLPVVTIAHWLEAYFRRSGLQNVQTVLNPLNKQLCRPQTPAIAKTDRIRFMVEGPSPDRRKNVVQTVELLEALGVEYLWVGSVIERGIAGPHCIAAIERVPYAQMLSYYSSCDVLVKLSNAEGMFGPPLEMLASGGTVIAWDVQGCEEYLTHMWNAWLVPMNNFAEAARAVRSLERDEPLLRSLKERARSTVEAWPDWAMQTQAICDAVKRVPEVDNALCFQRLQHVAMDRSIRLSRA